MMKLNLSHVALFHILIWIAIQQAYGWQGFWLFLGGEVTLCTFAYIVYVGKQRKT